MSCEEELIRRLCAALVGDVAPDLIRLISGRLSEALNDYEVTPKTQELVPRADALPKSVLEYIGAKTVEGLSQGSIDQYALVLRQFYADVRLQDTQITPRILRAWLYAYPKAHLTRSGAPVSEHTLSNKRLILHGYFEWAANNGYIPTNPCRAVAKIRYAKPCRRPLTEEQLAQLRYAAETEKERALLEVLYSSGCRVSELCHLDIADVCLQDRSVHLFGKGRKYRTSYISAAAVIALRYYLNGRTDRNPALFVTRRGLRCTPDGIRTLIHRLGGRVDMAALHPHLLRHTMATHAVNAGMPIQEVSALLGHESVETTMIYAHTSGTALQQDYFRCVG